MTEPDPLTQHLEQSRRMGWFLVVMLGIVLVVYVVATLTSGFKPGVVVFGALVSLIGVVLAYRTWRHNILKTDRLLDEAIEGMDISLADSADDLEDDE
jgi:Flp pilus assembly protein TadB